MTIALAACDRATGEGEDTDSTAVEAPTPTELRAELDTKIKYSPDEPNLYFQRAQLAWQLDDSTEAIKDVVRAMQLDSLNPAYPELLGFFYYAQGKDQLATDVLERAVALESENPEPYHQLATLATMRGDFTEALQRHDGALGFAPDSAIYLLGKAHTLRKAGRAQAAVPVLERALANDSLNTKVLSELFEVYFFDLDNRDKAIGYNDRIFAITDRHPLGHYNLGQVYFREYQKAAASGDPQADRRLNAALNSYNSAIASAPNFAKAVYARGYVQYEKQDYDAALSDFQRAAELDPHDHRVQFMLGALYEYYDDRQTALQHYRKAVQLKPDFADAKQAVQELEK